MIHSLFQDLHHALRSLGRSPGFTAMAVLCLALGLGATIAVYSLMHLIFFRPLPVEKPEELVRIYNDYTHGHRWAELSYPGYVDYSELTQSFSGLVAEGLTPVSLKTGGRNERTWGALVSGDYFEVLGIEAIHGRTFAPSEGRQPGRDPVVVIGYGLWRQRFGGRTTAIGETLVLNGHPFTVIGVAPREFQGTMVGLVPHLWMPVTMQAQIAPGSDWLEERRFRPLWVLGRLRPDVTVEQAKAALNAKAQRLKETYPDAYETLAGITVLPEVEGGFHPHFRGHFLAFLSLMLGVVGTVLLIACANVAGLLVARGAARARELAVRQALGAGRGRQLCHLLAESLILTLLAGAVGLLIAYASGRLIQGMQLPMDVPVALKPVIDTNVLAFAGAVTLLTTFVAGLAPALRSTRRDVLESLREAASTPTVSRSRLRNLLVAGQVALTLLLMIGAGLFLESLQNARHIDLGFDPRGMVVASVDVGLQGYDHEAGQQLLDELLMRVRGLPGVEAASFANFVPFDLDPQRTWAIPQGYEIPDDGSRPLVDVNVVTAGYLEIMKIPLVEGRDFRRSDDGDSRPVVIVSQTLTERFWPGENPLGKQIEVLGQQREVVGMARDSKVTTLGEPLPFVYLPQRQRYQAATTIHVRSRQAPEVVLSAVRSELHALDSDLTLFAAETMEDRLGLALLPFRLGASVLGVFGFLGLLLASVGLYGVLAYAVSQRRREIGIRMAMGARPGQVLAVVARQGLILTAAGLAVGGLLAAILVRYVPSVLYGVEGLDPAVAIGTTALLGLVALIACLIPALKATRFEPSVILRG